MKFLSRHDIPATTKAAVSAALACDVVDWLDVAAFCASPIRPSQMWQKLEEFVIECAYARVHSASGRAKHAAVVTARDQAAAAERKRLEHPAACDCEQHRPELYFDGDGKDCRSGSA